MILALETSCDDTCAAVVTHAGEIRSNAGAITLYERFGFRSAGVRRRYYQDNGEDAIVMWRTPATLRGTLDDVPGHE